MVQRNPKSLYEADETAWLEATARLVAQRLWDQVDANSLAEYLGDMARRDKREVESRLTVLLTHLLKWAHQPEKRSGSWKATVLTRQFELEFDVTGGVLRRHALDLLGTVYARAITIAAAETGLDASVFPPECPHELDELLKSDVLDP